MMNKKLLLFTLSGFFSCFSMGDNTLQGKIRDAELITAQTKKVQEKLADMRAKGNSAATELHAAAGLGFKEYIETWVGLHTNDRDFKEKVNKHDSFMLTPRQMAIYAQRLEIANYLAGLEKQ